jgi:hypothetical protein
MSPPDEQILIEKLRRLPPQRRREVEDFVDFLAARERGQALEAFLAVADQVAQAGVPPMSAEEIQAEIDAYRDERRRAARP